MLTGNKGEWSEIYTLLKLIAEGEMLKGDKQLNPLSDERYKVIALERNEATTGITTYSIKGKTVEITNPIESITLDREIFSTEANKLLDVIKSQTGTVEIPTTEQFMAQALTFSIKARSQDKTDIKVEIHDHRTSISHTRGFSIKSQLGRPSTLLNASRHTLFRYKINNITDDQATAINNISSSSAVIDRIQSIDCWKIFSVEPLGPTSKTFSQNLTLIDDALPEVISSLLWKFYTENVHPIDELLPIIASQNVRNYEFTDNEMLYSSKIKRLLASSALGMKPAKCWNNTYDANGGYLIVLRTGEIISYHIYDKEDFEDYLFHNTKLVTPSTSRLGACIISKDTDGHYIDLALQIRFCL